MQAPETSMKPESSPDFIGELCRFGHHAAANRLRALEKEVARLRLQLAACGVAAMANTEESIKGRIGPDSPYYCASYADVCRAVDREMTLRTELIEAGKSRYGDVHDASELLHLRAANLIEALDNGRPALALDVTRKVVALEEAMDDYDQAVKGQQS